MPPALSGGLPPRNGLARARPGGVPPRGAVALRLRNNLAVPSLVQIAGKQVFARRASLRVAYRVRAPRTIPPIVHARRATGYVPRCPVNVSRTDRRGDDYNRPVPVRPHRSAR